jgi:beta-xylosidase
MSLTAASPSPTAPWIPDQTDGTFQNPILHADYSDPDAVRVGDDFWLVSSSFNHAPGLPILHSRDLINWTLVNHALPLQIPADHFSVPRHGQGVWAPTIRHHAGKFWIYYPDPDFGIYLTTATDPRGAWSAPVLVKGGKGLIDPCPFWDDEGQVYLVHAWAKSRAGISNLLTLHKLNAEGTRVIDDGKIIIDANQMPGWRTLEGPKLYKRKGYFYIFAPAGGVTEGYQAVFRSTNIYGPYENRIVLEQGKTSVNGPHQGAWIDTPSGENWFIHFQDKGPYGRIVHLQPMTWRADDWPAMGTAVETGAEKGEPVITHKKPAIANTTARNDPASPAIATPVTSDEFESSTLGLQWQWQANPRKEWISFTAQPGWARLTSVPAPAAGTLWFAPNLLMQKFPAPAFTATTRLNLSAAVDGESAGLIVFGYDYGWIGLRRTQTGQRLVAIFNKAADKQGVEKEMAGIDLDGEPIFLRVTVNAGAQCQFAYSKDGVKFTPLGTPFKASVSRWVGAKMGIFSAAPPEGKQVGHADFEWFRVTP